jgi:Protein of unknown function (DUF962)
MDERIDRYEKSHQNPINRVFHTFGIPMIAVSIPLFLIARWFEDFGKFRCRCLRQVGFANCLDTSSKVSHPNSSKTGGFCSSEFVRGRGFYAAMTNSSLIGNH